MIKVWNRKNLLRAGALVLCALVLAAGLEWLMLRTLPPIFVDSKVEISMDPGLMERSATYLHPSGRLALVEEWYLPRFLVEFVIQLAVLVLIFPLGLGRKAMGALRGLAASLKRVWREEKKRNLKLAGCFLLAWIAGYVICRACVLDVYSRDNWITHAVSCWAGVSAGCLVTFRRTLGKKPEIFFVILTLIYGGIMTYFLPDCTRVALDDGFHYQHAANYSTVGHVRFTGAEWDSMQEFFQMQDHLDQRDAYNAERDEKHKNGAVFVTTGFHLDPKEYWMATSGLGLFLGRVLNLRFWEYWSMGRFTGLLCYVIIGYFAIRRLKSGKMILALCLMLPSSAFLASAYSYDPGVTAGFYLSFAYWAAQWQEREKKLQNKDVAVMVAGMLIALYAKAIYFPAMLIFLFLPKSKFRDRAHRRNYTLTILFAVAAVMLYILVPLSRSGGQADTRAEGEVDTFRQIQFILTHPLEYAVYLWHEVRDYLDPNQLTGATNAFGYMGGGRSTTLILMILAVTAFTDQQEEGLLPPGGVRAAGLGILFGTLILMMTAMYAWFSEVGSSDFGGVQERYLIPLIYPAMSMMGSNQMKNKINPALYNGLLFGAMQFAAFSGVILTTIEIYR